jgi:hypothetical protein
MCITDGLVSVLEEHSQPRRNIESRGPACAKWQRGGSLGGHLPLWLTPLDRSAFVPPALWSARDKENEVSVGQVGQPACRRKMGSGARGFLVRLAQNGKEGDRSEGIFRSG